MFVYLPMRPGPGRNYTTGITGRQDQRTSNEGNTNVLTWFPDCDIVRTSKLRNTNVLTWFRDCYIVRTSNN